MKRTCIVLLFWTAMMSAPAQTPAPVAVALGGRTESLHAPARVAAAPDGNIFVTDPQAGQVVVFDPFGRRVESREGFAGPLGIAVDRRGRIYLAEEGPGSVSVFDGQWNRLTRLGIGEGEFLLPNHIALDPTSDPQPVYISDSRANAIKVYVGAALVGRFGTAGQGSGQFDFPAGLCVSTNGEVFVVDQNNDRVQVFDRAGLFLRAFSLGTSSPSGRSQGVCLDHAGRLYVADALQGLVRVFDAATGALLSSVGAFGRLTGQLASPAGLALDEVNRLFVTSANTRRVELYGLDSFLHLTTQPAAHTIAAGASVAFAVVAGDGGPFAWQWHKDGGVVQDATTATFTIMGAGEDDAGAYSVVVTGPAGAFTSGVSRLTIQLPPRILSHPQNQTVLRGSNVVLAVFAEGAALKYQWQLNGLNVEGATNSTLVLQDVQTYQAGFYSVGVSNTVGAVVSAPASLTVLTPPSVMEILSSTVITNDWFHLLFNADPGFAYAIEASDDLLRWQSLTNFRHDAGLSEFTDTDSTNFWNRFYRLRWAP